LQLTNTPPEAFAGAVDYFAVCILALLFIYFYPRGICYSLFGGKGV